MNHGQDQRYAEAKGNPVAQKSIKDEILKITQGTQFDTTIVARV